MTLVSFSPAICLRCKWRHEPGTTGTCTNTVRPLVDGTPGPPEECGGMLLEVLVEWPEPRERSAA